MSFREFRDESGTEWEVWEVRPALVERRVVTGAPGETDRRTTPRRRAPVADDLRFGWLVFQSGASKRRLAPVPAGWDRFDLDGLIELLGKASTRNGPRIALSGDETLTSPPVRSISTRLS
jgi:hypothetical protein